MVPLGNCQFQKRPENAKISHSFASDMSKTALNCKKKKYTYYLLLRYVLSAVKSGRNVFFTGGAGTGKSFLVQKIIGVISFH